LSLLVLGVVGALALFGAAAAVIFLLTDRDKRPPDRD
jgi:hypothetical protein